MNVEVKLYHYHDLDLVKLYQAGALSFSMATKLALRAYAKKEYFRFEISEPKEAKPISRAYRFRINLDEKKDADIIELLQKIHHGNRNNFIKTILRSYICCAIPADYFDEKDSQYFQERYEEMFSNRKKVSCAMKRFASDAKRPNIKSQIKNNTKQESKAATEPYEKTVSQTLRQQPEKPFASDAKKTTAYEEITSPTLKYPFASDAKTANPAAVSSRSEVPERQASNSDEFASDANNESEDLEITNMFINIIN